jgi:signal transduction histidine kinase
MTAGNGRVEAGAALEAAGTWTDGDGRTPRADLALDAAGLGAWEIVPASEECRWSDRAKELLGFSRRDVVTYERFLSTMRPVDRVRCVEAFLRAIEPHGDAMFRVEYQLGEDASRWVALTGGAFVDDRPAVRLVGTIEDVTAEMTERARLAELRHDVRSPLNAICVATELLRGASTREPAVLLSRIAAMARRASRMVDRIAASSAGGPPPPLQTELLSLSELCAEVVGEVQLAHPGCSVQLEAPTPCRGEWDRDRLFQLVRNLLSNAIEHGDARSPMVVSVVENARRALLTVSNGGEPIPHDVRERLLDPFASRRDRRGLGLLIVHDVAAAHGGAVELTSDPAGTVVRVRLPKRRIGAEQSRRS